MLKLFLIALVLTGAALLNPGMREKAKPHVQFLTDPVYSWQVNSRTAEITRRLEEEIERGKPIPSDAAFHDFLRTSFFGADGHLDPWGNPYVLKRQRVANRETSFRVVSAGPDGKLNTPDDIRGKPIGAVTGK